MIVLDTNVLIDMKDFYFGTRPLRRGLKDVLLQFPYTSPPIVDINYGWAVTELSWLRGSGHEATRRRTFAHAAEAIIHWDAAAIERNFANRHPPVNRDRMWPRVPLLPNSESADPRPMLVPVYGSLLYLLQLHLQRDRIRSKGSAWALQQYVSWATNTLGIRSSHALGLALALLTGRADAKEDAIRVFKLSGSESADELAAKAWNVAWDIAMTTLPEGIGYRLLPVDTARRTVLITRDKDPSIVRLISDIKVIMDAGSVSIPMTLVDQRLAEGIDTQTIDEILALARIVHGSVA